MGGRYGTKIVALLGIAAFIVLGAIRARHLTAVNFSDVGKAITAVAVLVTAWEQVLWRWLRLPGRPPKLHGTWKMKLTRTSDAKADSNAKDSGVRVKEPRTQTCYLSIWQTASTIKANLLFGDGESKITTAVFAKDDQDRYVHVFYDFVPADESKSGPRRKGAASLKIEPKTLDGTYWNDEKMQGQLKSQGRVAKPSKTYAQAKARTRRL